MFLHQSLNTQKFKSDKKLQLLKKRIITPGQFLAILQPSDPYILIGITIVDKEKQDEFIKQWKNKQRNIQNITQLPKITTKQFIDNLDIVKENFIQTSETIEEFRQKLKVSTCKPCTKNRYLLIIAQIIKKHFKDGRQYSQADYALFKKILNKYFPFQESNGVISLQVSHFYDNTWIQPDSLINIGYDLIEGLTNCFECTKKHIGRAKRFYSQLYLGYPNHIQMMFNEFTQANKVVEQAFVLYWDSLSELDMASCQLVGQIIDLPKNYREQIIQLANNIRKARILYQQNIQNIPDWNQLLIDVQRLQNKTNKYLKNKDKNEK